MKATRRLPLAPIDTGETIDLQRPFIRGDCVDGPRPCPWVGCHHNLFWDTFPAALKGPIEQGPEDMPADRSCTLDIADDGGIYLHEIGDIYGCTRQYIRQIEASAIRNAVNGSRRIGMTGDDFFGSWHGSRISAFAEIGDGRSTGGAGADDLTDSMTGSRGAGLDLDARFAERIADIYDRICNEQAAARVTGILYIRQAPVQARDTLPGWGDGVEIVGVRVDEEECPRDASGAIMWGGADRIEWEARRSETEAPEPVVMPAEPACKYEDVEYVVEFEAVSTTIGEATYEMDESMPNVDASNTHLRPRDIEVLEAVTEWCSRNSEPPKMKDIATDIEASLSAVTNVAVRLRALGRLAPGARDGRLRLACASAVKVDVTRKAVASTARAAGTSPTTNPIATPRASEETLEERAARELEYMERDIATHESALAALIIEAERRRKVLAVLRDEA